jgi:Leucine-rich repeat (LRR) protein
MRRISKIIIISLLFISIIIATTVGIITNMKLLDIFNITFINLLFSFIIVLGWSQLNRLNKKNKNYEGIVEVRGKEYNIWEGKLYLFNKEIKEIEEIKGFDNIKELTDLNLAGNHITNISHLDNLKKLKVLKLRNNKIRMIRGLDNLKNLEELYLDGNQIQKINGLKNLLNLKILNLNSNQIDYIQGLENLNKLQELYIGENSIPQDLIEDLGGINKEGRVNNPQKYVNYSLLQY